MKFYLHRCKFQQTNPNFVACLNLVEIKRNIEYEIAESKGKLRQNFEKWTLNLLIFLFYFCLFALHRSYHHSFIFNLCEDWGVVCECCESISVGCECMFVFVFCPLFCLFVWVDNSLIPFFGKKSLSFLSFRLFRAFSGCVHLPFLTFVLVLLAKILLHTKENPIINQSHINKQHLMIIRNLRGAVNIFVEQDIYFE